MPDKRDPHIAQALCNFHQEEIETAIRQMKIEGASLEESERALRGLADQVRAMADGLREQWATLLDDTVYEMHRRASEAGGES